MKEVGEKNFNHMCFKNLDEMCETLLRGNEIQFSYNSQLYCLFANYNNEVVTGAIICKVYGEENFIKLCDLKDYKIQGSRFEDIFNDIQIIDRVI